MRARVKNWFSSSIDRSSLSLVIFVTLTVANMLVLLLFVALHSLVDYVCTQFARLMRDEGASITAIAGVL